MPEKFYLTTPIYYVNARPHIGHAYTTIVADVLARRHRLMGDDTYFLTGTDEHGQKIERSAAAAGIPPKEFADQVSKSFSDLWQRMGITNDQFIRTTDEAHKRGVQKLFTTLQQRGAIYLDSYTGQYCVSEEMFVEGPPGTIGPDGRPTETVTEENYFFKLSEYQEPLLDLIESNTLVIEPESRRNEVLSFLRSGLRDLSISRSSFTWGIPVPKPSTTPGAPGLAPETWAGAERTPAQDHVIYVWLDALANYMTAVGYGSDDPIEIAKFQKYWPADLHIVGKEIIRFHCVYWPAFLLAAGLPLPKKVVAHGWLLFDDSKMSKSRGNVVRTETILDAFGTLCPPSPIATAKNAVILSEAKDPRSSSEAPTPSRHDRDLFAADVLRYFLLREIPFGQDGSFTFEALITRYNADLANGYGNLVSRTLNLIRQNFDSIVPEAVSLSEAAETLAESDDPRLNLNFGYMQSLAKQTTDFTTPQTLDTLQFHVFLTEIAMRIGVVDGFVSVHKPWELARSDDEDNRSYLSNVLYTAAESIRIITALLYPILPYATANVWRQLGLGDIELAAKNGDLKNLKWGGLEVGKPIGSLSPVFPRIYDKDIPEFIKTMADMEQKPNMPLGANAQADALTPEASEFPETPIASALAEAPKSKLVDESFVAPPVPATTFDPAAGPRTTSLAEPNPGAQVAGSNAATTERPGTPAHTEAASGIFRAPTESGAPGLASETWVPADASPQITIDDFAKIELRVAQILVCERIPKADKLLRLEVDLGYERRQILSGIAEWYTPEELIGRRIIVITNLAPRKMRGLESHGMLLAASTEGGKPHLATVEAAADLPLGTRLK